MKIKHLTIFTLCLSSFAFAIDNASIEQCNRGSDNACNDVAIHYFENNDVSNALKYAEKSCQLGNAGNCHNAGFIYLQQQNLSKAQKLFEKACDKGNGASCQALGVSYEKGENGVKQDIKKAEKYYEKMCYGEDIPQLPKGEHRCDYLSGLAGNYYLGKNGFPKDINKAVLNFMKACDGGAIKSGCESAASIAVSDFSSDKEKLAGITGFACKKGEKKICEWREKNLTEMQRLYFIPKDRSEFNKLIKMK